MTRKTNKPPVNKDTFAFFVTKVAQTLSHKPGVRKNDVVFTPLEVETIERLHSRVLELIEPFKIGAQVINSKDRPADLNLEHNWSSFVVTGLSERADNYIQQTGYYARAFHEIAGIAVATADAFLGMMHAPTTMDFAPNMQVHGKDLKDRPVTWIAPVKTTAEAYHHARMEYTAREYLNKLASRKSKNQSYAMQLHEVHGAMVDALHVMTAALTVAKIYSTKKWIVCKD